MNNNAIITCKTCAAKNRVRLDKIDFLPQCGKCKTQLEIPDKAVNINEKEFQKEVLNETIPTVVDFWAPWCGPCRMVGPILDEIAGKYRGKVKVVKVNSDENPGLTTQYRVQGIPTIILFREGKESDRIVGAAPKENILQFLHL